MLTTAVDECRCLSRLKEWQVRPMPHIDSHAVRLEYKGYIDRIQAMKQQRDKSVSRMYRCPEIDPTQRQLYCGIAKQGQERLSDKPVNQSPTKS